MQQQTPPSKTNKHCRMCIPRMIVRILISLLACFSCHHRYYYLAPALLFLVISAMKMKCVWCFFCVCASACSCAVLQQLLLVFLLLQPFPTSWIDKDSPCLLFLFCKVDCIAAELFFFCYCCCCFCLLLPLCWPCQFHAAMSFPKLLARW